MIIDGLQIENKTEMASFLMIGQSNMAGRGDFGEVDPIRNKRCFMMRLGRWQRMAEPINPDRAIFDCEFHSGTNLCASFADMYAKHYDRDIGLIPCADGGTKIKQWMPGEILYDHAVYMTRLAKRTSKLEGILWHQGESDCYEEDIVKYKERFKIVMSTLRKELDAEELPLIIGEITENMGERWARGDYPKRMNCLLHELADEVPNCKIVKAADLELRDGIHFNSRSLRTLGCRYFESYRSAVEQK